MTFAVAHRFSVALVLAAVQHGGAEPPQSVLTEGRGETVAVFDGTQIVVDGVRSVPAGVRENLRALNDSLRALPWYADRLVIELSDDGGAMLVHQAHDPFDADPPSPTGVWVWPDWQRADAFVSVPEFSRARFLSNRHVMFWHYDAGPGGPYDLRFDSRVMNVDSPQIRLHWPASIAGSFGAKLRLDARGRWAGVAYPGGELWVGDLDPRDDDPLAHATRIDLPGPVEDVVLLHEGEVVVVEMKKHHEEPPPGVWYCPSDFRDGGLLSLSIANGRGLDSLDGYFICAGYDRARGRLSSWIIGIARHCIADLADARAATPARRGDSVLNELAGEDELAAWWKAECEREILRQAMQELRESTRADPRTLRAFGMVAFEQRPAADVARALGMSLNDVYLAKHRCLSRLRQIVQRIEALYE